MSLCECGCGQEANKGKRFIIGHHVRGKRAWNKGLTKETDERVLKYSKTLTGRKLSKEHIEKTRKNQKYHTGKDRHQYGKPRTEEVKEKIRKKLKGKRASIKTEFKKGCISWCKGKKTGVVPWNKGLTKETDERIKIVSENASKRMKGKKQSKELIEKRISPRRGKPRSELHSRNLIWSLFSSPSNPEIDLHLLLEEILPEEYVYTGHGEIIIGSLCPDFVNIKGKMKIIEMFGEPYHDPANTYLDKISWKRQEWGRKALFGQYGYNTLVVWSNELKNKDTLTEKLLAFHSEKDL